MTDQDWLPNFFVAGFPKTGTSSLHTWLADHPDALGSVEKEACFFVDEGTHVFRAEQNVMNGLETYRDQFEFAEGAKPKVIIESTPSYVYQKAALEWIPDLPSQPKCLFVVRNPVDQIQSVFNYYRNNWTYIPDDLSFADFLAKVRDGTAAFGGNELAENALEFARYETFLTKWRDRLGDRFQVCTFDELKANPRGLTARIAAWIGLDPGFYDHYDFPRENETYVPRSRFLQRINVAVRDSLPKGAAYNAARRLYRSLNTTKHGKERLDEVEIENLRQEFEGANKALAEAFDLDLSNWAVKP